VSLFASHAPNSFRNPTGVFLCLDCSAAHRALGVHLTFVRSTDLDEWTQKQIDAMRLGGNGNAREYFRKHGFSDLNGGTKLEKKYTSKAAVTYRAELLKLVEAEAVRRGDVDGNSTTAEVNSSPSSTLLMSHLDMADHRDAQEEKNNQIKANNNNNNVLVPSATKASSLPGASKLLVSAASIKAPNDVSTLRKPAVNLTNNSLLKKPTSSKIRMGVKLTTSDYAHTHAAADEESFENVEDTQKASLEADRKAQQMAEDEALAKRLQAELE
jgi:ADP-ribosylation factor GTPase-activating protein 2/3